MKIRFAFLPLLPFLLVAAPSPARAQQMNYQGRLTDEKGLPLTDKTYKLEFTLWDGATEGKQIWGPFTLDGAKGDGKGPAADLVNGRFNTILGPKDTAGRLLTAAFAASPRYLQIKVESSAPLSPRQQLLDAPSAISAHYALEAARIGNLTTSAGNLGIGVADPKFPLSLPAATGDKISLSGASGPHFGFGIQTNLIQIHGDTLAADVAFGYGTSADFTETMRVKGNGNVGIGSTTPAGKLEIRAGNDDGSDLVAAISLPYRTGGYRHFISTRHQGTANDGNAIDFWVNKRGQLAQESSGLDAGNTRALTITDRGVGVGVKAPRAALEVKAADYNQLRLSYGDVASWTLGANNNNTLILGAPAGSVGGFINGANGNYEQGSDLRLKEDVREIGPVLEKAMRLRPVSYHFKGNEEASPRANGFIAQEVARIFPDMVKEQGGYLALGYAEFAPVAIGAIQELKSEADRRESEVKTLTAQNAALLERLTSQESDGAELRARLERMEKSLAAFTNPDRPAEPGPQAAEQGK